MSFGAQQFPGTMNGSRQGGFSIGVDYGTNSVRAVVVCVADGTDIATCVYDYPSGERGILLDGRNPHLARQNPADYIDGFYRSVHGAVHAASRKRGFRPDRVVGIGIDATGSTPIPVARDGSPLALDPRYRQNLAAHAWLWKDHTSAAEAAEITERASRAKDPYLARCGGVYSSEWYWSKILHCRRTSPEVFKAAYAWVELADFIPALVTGNPSPKRLPRGICAAGHKAMYHENWGGLPRRAFLRRLDPGLAAVADRYVPRAATSDQAAGRLAAEVAVRVGLPVGIPVAVGAFDAHMGAVGAGVKPGTLVKIIGTSTCDVTVWPLDQPLPDIPGLCGIVPGSVIPGMYGLEAGQSAVGDLLNWFVTELAPNGHAANGDAHDGLSRSAAVIAPGASGLLALDWNNGNRTVLVDPLLGGLLVGQTLATTAAEVYRALIEATAFGALTIVDRFEEYGVPIRNVTACGGIAEKNPLVMQIYADVLGRTLRVSRSTQTCALGAAIFGAVVGGAHRNVEAAQRHMCGAGRAVYRPNRAARRIYGELYELYRQLHDAFGTPSRRDRLDQVMKRLIALRDRARRKGRPCSKP